MQDRKVGSTDAGPGVSRGRPALNAADAPADDSTECSRVLVVDDDLKTRDLLSVVLGQNGYAVVTASTGREALQRAEENALDMALLDIMLPDARGCDLLSPLRKIHPDIAVVIVTAYASTDTAVQALNEGAKAYITKPLRLAKVLGTVQKIAEEQRQARKEEQMKEDLLRYAARLEAQNEELGAFAHTVAHDLKAPSYKIAGYAETLLEDEYEPLPQEVQRECLRIMAQGARQMSTLVDELLLLAHVRSDEVELVPLSMEEIIHSVQDRLALMMERHQAELTGPDAWPTALGHASWVEEVWVNYVSNAIRYGGKPEEGIPPRIELGHGPSGCEHPGENAPRTPSEIGSHVRFWVRDNGRGLTRQEQGRLFTPFTRLAQVGTKGHGLGLSVVRRIVEKLGGEVGVESERGEGSVFSFTLQRVDEASL